MSPESPDLKQGSPLRLSDELISLGQNDLRIGTLCENATKGDAEAQCQLGEIFEWGRFGVQEDLYTAKYWYGLAKENGHRAGSEHYDSLVRRYEFLKMRDYVFSDDLLTLAKSDPDIKKICEGARHGDAGAQCQLGEIYEEGRYGIKEDLRLAKYWYRIAKANGDEWAAVHLDALLKTNPWLN